MKNYTLPEEVQKILDKFRNKKFQIYIVGGAVRDLLMGKKVSDWDFTTDAKPEEILKLFPNAFYDNKFGTVGIPMAHLGGGLMEITTMRKEGEYKDFRHPEKVGWTNKIEEDLARRDFTVNAIAMRLHLPGEAKQPSESHLEGDVEIVDPYHGQDDIKEKKIRAVGDPTKRFQEDALRLIRTIRFSAQLGFEIDEKTFKALKENANLIKQIAWERIRDELFKILESENAYDGIVKLRETRLLQIILPELEACFGIVQEGPKHDRTYDIGEHSLLALKHTPSTDPLVRFATLLHDVGKPDTVSTSDDKNVTFYNHDLVGGQVILKIAKRFNLSKKQTDKLYKLVRWHMFTVSEDQTDSAIRRFIKNVGLENIEDMMALRVGDRLGGGTPTETSWRIEKFKERIKQVLKKPFSISDLKINGNDVMNILGIKPGPKVGEILEKLFQEVLEDSSKNKKEYLIKRIRDL
ncbi:MAG: CCA tRNA nucleotidyltransferase [Patescibacteria group bacterium]